MLQLMNSLHLEKDPIKHIAGSVLGEGETFFLPTLIEKRTESKKCIDLVTRLKCY